MNTRTLWIALCLASALTAADLPDSHDPPGMKRYEGSEIIGYHAPKFEQFILPLSAPTSYGPAVYAKSQKVDGLVSRYTYIAPAGRTTTEVARNYKLEFQRLGLTTLYSKTNAEKGWFGPTFESIAEEDKLGQILAYNEAQEQVIAAKSKDAQPTYYFLLVTAYKDGIIPERLAGTVTAGRVLAELVVISPDQMSEKMVFVNAEEMARSMKDTGKIALYGIYFDTGKDVVKPDSQPTMAEIAKLLKSNPQLKFRVVGHTDNTGNVAGNLDLSKRRAAAVTQALTTQFGIQATRLDAFGCGSYAPVATNDTDEGKAKNRRVELVQW